MSHRNMNCGCSSHAALQRTPLASGLDALACPACGRVLLNLDDYRLWRDRQPKDSPPTVASTDFYGDDGRQARICPSCSRIMSRPRSGTAPDFHIDHCVSCQLVWLDAGQWQLLAKAGLVLQLDTVLDEKWQQKLREDEARQRRAAELSQRFGDDAMAEVQRIRLWLASQPQRRELLALIGSPDQ